MTAADGARQRVRVATGRGRWIIAATALGSGMIFLDGTVVNVALPTIQRNLTAPLAGLQWIVNSYTLFLAAFLLVGGDLGDIYGRKSIFVSGLVIFTGASVGCGVAPNLTALIAARAVQGLGGALLVPGSLAMIRAVIAPEDSSFAIGLWAGFSGVTTAAGPLLGGYLISALSWRAIFFLNVPIAMLTLFATLRHVPANRDEDAVRVIDWPAALTTVAGLGGLIFGLIEGPQNGWASPTVIGALAVGLAGIVLFPVRERLAAHPMVPLGVFRSRNFSGANLATLGVYFTLSGVLLFLVLYLQEVQGYTPLQAGASALPITVLLLLLSPISGRLMSRFGARVFMVGGPLVVAMGYFLLILVGSGSTYLFPVFPSLVLAGLGMSAFVTPLTTTVMSSVPGAMAGVASGVNNAVSRVAGLLAVAVLGAVVATAFNHAFESRVQTLNISPSDRAFLIAHEDRLADVPIPRHLTPSQHAAVQAAVHDSFTVGFRWDMAICAALCLASAGICALTIRDVASQE